MITDNIKEIIREIERNCNTVVCVCQIEPREYSGTYPISSEDYKKFQYSINQRLKKQLSNRTIHFNNLIFKQSLSSDGVHWSVEGKERVKNKFRKVILGLMPAEIKTDDHSMSDEVVP